MQNREINNKNEAITVQSFNGQTNFSLALQIRIDNETAVRELAYRSNKIYENCTQYRNIKEDPSNFHITIALFFPEVDKKQLEEIKSVMKYVSDKYANTSFDITLTDENKIYIRSQE